MTTLPDISVIMPVRDGAGTIDAQLEALSRQSFDGFWELVVADNGSRDGSAAHARRWRDRLPRLHVIDASSVSSSYAARNLGVRAASGHRLAFCDADDVVAPGWLAALAGGLERWPLVAGPIDLAVLNPPEVVAWRRNPSWDRLPAWHGFLPGALTSNLGVRREVFDALGGFKPVRSGSDLRFVWQAQLAGWELGYAPGALVHRREPVAWTRYARRSVRYGMGEPALFAEFHGRGMPRSPLRVAATRWLAILFGWPALAVPGWRYAWLDVAGHRLGRALGSVRARTLYA